MSIFPFVGQSSPPLDETVEATISKSDSEEIEAFFAVYVPRDIRLRARTQLRLCCIPTSKRCELNDYEEKQKNIMIGDGSSDRPMCSNEKAFIFLKSDGIVTAVKPEQIGRASCRERV